MSEPKVEIVLSESAAETKIHAEVTEQLEEPNDLIVVASNPEQMQVAQSNLVSYFKKKVDKLTDEVKAAEENVKIAKQRKWKVTPFESLLSKVQKDKEFYDKIVVALEAGFVIIPNLNELDIFAIRTTRKKPKKNLAKGGSTWVNQPEAQVSNSPPVGEGRYVNSDTKNKTWQNEFKNSNGETQKQMVAAAVAFDDVDFPFRFAKPEILERTAEAMKLLCFDDIGILPNRRIRRGDPMVVGRIFTKRGSQIKAVSFLITWFVNTADI